MGKRLATTLAILGAGLALALPAPSPRADWLSSPKRGHVGWYGYEPPHKEDKKKKQAKKPPRISPEQTKQTAAPPAPPEWPDPDALYHMKTADISKWLDKASDEAVSKPTEENVKRWVEYMRVTDRKATEFSGMWAWVMQNNPSLYREAALYPTVGPGNRAFWNSVWQEVYAIMSEKKDDYALLFFTGPDRFSSAMAFILESFRQDHPGWQVREISVDEQPGIARKLGITYVPQVWLLPKKTQKPIPVTAGPVSVADLERRIYHTVLVLENKLPPNYAPFHPWQVQQAKNTPPALP